MCRRELLLVPLEVDSWDERSDWWCCCCRGSSWGIWLRMGTWPTEFHTLKSPDTTEGEKVCFSFFCCWLEDDDDDELGWRTLTLLKVESLIEKLLILKATWA